MKSTSTSLGKKSTTNSTASATAAANAAAAAVRSNIIKKPLGKVTTTTTVAKSKIDTNGKIDNGITDKHLNGDHITEDLVINKTTTTLIDVDNKTFDKHENLNINENLQNIIIDSTTD